MIKENNKTETKIPFSTTEEELKALPMLKQYLLNDQFMNKDFVEKIVKLAEKDQGVFDMIILWYEAYEEKRDCQKDLEAMLEEQEFWNEKEKLGLQK